MVGIQYDLYNALCISKIKLGGIIIEEAKMHEIFEKMA